MSELNARLKEIHSDEPEITDYLEKLSSDNNGQLIGLDFKFKTPKKIQIKLKSRKLSEIRDLLRYTIIFSKEDYIKGVYDSYSTLIDDPKFTTKNSWLKQRWCIGDMYQGVNTSWIYNNKFNFELQFHTQLSFDRNDHNLYDIYSEYGCDKLSLNDPKYKSKCEDMRQSGLASELSIPIPEGLDGKYCNITVDKWAKLIIIKNRERIFMIFVLILLIGLYLMRK